MFTRGIAVFVVANVLLTSLPVLAQSSDLLASAERAALTMGLEQDLEQDLNVVRRRRSGIAGAVGAVLTGVGIYLALQPVACSDAMGKANHQTFWGSDLVFSAERLRGKCTIKVSEVYEGNRTYHYYGLDYPDGLGWTLQNVRGEPEVPTVTTDNRTNHIGWATAAAGGVLLAWGLRGVDVPVRLDVAPTGGFRVSNSVGW